MKPTAQSIRALALLTLGLLVTACGGDDGDAPAKTPEDSTPARAAGGADKTGEASGSSTRKPTRRDTGVDNIAVDITPAADPTDEEATATLRGTVFLDGKIPKRRPVAMDHIPGCRKHDEVLTETVIATEEGQLQNVFVYISRGIDKSTIPPAPDEPVVIEQKGCTYIPHVLTVRTGQELVIRNSDGANHNVNARPTHGSNKGFNQMQPPNGQDLVKTFARPEVAVPFGCDIHPWMKSYVAVMEHDYHAISDAEGNWSIEGLPAGDYYVESWHEKYKGKKAVLTVGAGETAEVSFRYSTKR
jgi:plastocyanin